MSARQRKVHSQNGTSSQKSLAPHAKKILQQSRKTYFLIVTLLGSLFLGYIAIANDLTPIRYGSKAIDSLAFSFNMQKSLYAVIIDAGSTGSRVLAFTFHQSFVDQSLILDDELFYQVKPGLSSFADNPKKGAESLIVLLDKAKTVIPKSEWSKTPLTMKATAGLRLLPGDEAQNLLDECSKLFEKSGFLVSKNSVAIMDGTDEGIFSWFTVNFLLDRLSTHSAANTVAALDLGGGSTQVTFSPENTEAMNPKHIFAINALSRNMTIYTHSLLGMGLMAARKEIITLSKSLEELRSLQSPESGSKIEVRSECVNPIVATEWSYGGQNYLVKGPKNGTHKIVKTANFAGVDEDRPIVRFKECLGIVKNYVNSIVDKPLGLKDHEISAFSYYFERAEEVALIDPFKGGVVTVDAFLNAAKDSCDYPNTEQPFMCLDLTFISVLLQDGFALEPSTKISLYKKINGHELSWALGAAFNIMQNGL